MEEISLRTALNNASIRPRPTVNKKNGKSTKGKKTAFLEGVTLKIKNIIPRRRSLMKKFTNTCPMEAIAREILGKLIFCIIPPAATILPVIEEIPPEKSVHTHIPKRANTGYGTSVEPMLSIPFLLKKINADTATIGIINAHIIPRTVCL